MDSHLCDHREAHQEGKDADRQQQQFTSVTGVEEGGIQV